MPSIAQQDYIVIDWDGKGQDNVEKKAQVDAILKKIFLANPLTLLSVIFKNYLSSKLELDPCLSISQDRTAGSVTMAFMSAEDISNYSYSFTV